jgi:hypothetical protein
MGRAGAKPREKRSGCATQPTQQTIRTTAAAVAQSTTRTAGSRRLSQSASAKRSMSEKLSNSSVLLTRSFYKKNTVRPFGLAAEYPMPSEDIK